MHTGHRTRNFHHKGNNCGGSHKKDECQVQGVEPKRCAICCGAHEATDCKRADFTQWRQQASKPNPSVRKSDKQTPAQHLRTQSASTRRSSRLKSNQRRSSHGAILVGYPEYLQRLHVVSKILAPGSTSVSSRQASIAVHIWLGYLKIIGNGNNQMRDLRRSSSVARRLIFRQIS